MAKAICKRQWKEYGCNDCQLNKICNDAVDSGKVDLYEIYKKGRADAIEEVLSHTKTIVDDDGIIVEAVLVKDIKKIKVRHNEL